MQGFVYAFAIAWLVTRIKKFVKTGLWRQYETFVFHHFMDEFWLIAVLRFVIVVVVLPYIGDVFEKEHGQDEIFIRVRADGATKDIAGVP